MMKKHQPARVTVNWCGQLQFDAVTSRGSKFTMDSSGSSGVSPMEAVLGGLCGCMGMDVVAILQKMRVDVGKVLVQASGERPDDAPRFFHRIDLEFQIQGNGTEQQVNRAVQLSADKYCSVLHSLRKDIEFTYRVIQAQAD